MKMKVLSFARKSGKFKDVKYDSIILYTLTIASCYNGVNSSLSGYPVDFHEVKIPVTRWVDVFPDHPCSFDFLETLSGKTIDVTFGMSTFNGVDRFTVESVKLLGGDE